MRYGICNEMFEGWQLADVFKCARDEGYSGVEVAPFTLADSVTEIPAAQRAAIRDAAAAAEVAVIGLHWLLVKPAGLYINHPDDVLRERTRDYFIELIHCCADCGGELMVIGSPKQRNVVPGETYEATWNRTVDVFRYCLDVAAARAVTLCIEPLAPTETDFLQTAAEGARMVNEINHPNFKLHLDVKAMSSEGRPIPEIVSEFVPVTGHFHANDANLRGPGFGDVDFVPIFRSLKNGGYSGYVSVEVFDFSPDPVTIARESIGYMKECAAQA